MTQTILDLMQWRVTYMAEKFAHDWLTKTITIIILFLNNVSEHYNG